MNAQIQQIIENRAKDSTEVSSCLSQWQERKTQCGTLKRDIAELRRVCERALAGASVDMVQSYHDLLQYLDEVERKQLLRKMQADCSFALAGLEKLNQRFNRKTINIAVAGVGRCGKSTALKAIIGQNQDDNSTIPSGNGPAITAGKSTISCVLTTEEEKTVVRFHTAESFLNELVNPLLQSISLSEYQCGTIDDVETLDYGLLRQALEMKAKDATEAVKSAELAVHQAEDKTAAELHLQQTRAYSTSFNLNYERLSHLKKILEAYPHFRTRLTGGCDTVPLNQTYRYVSYPKNGEPAICYAVKECHIYSRFPNNEVQALELTDLPGLGTGSQSEKKCFLEGFNYAVDLALMIRRPEGLFQNFTTEADLGVMDVLGATFGENHLHECMVMFQNDANLPQADIERAYERITEWNKLRKDEVTVIRGNAFDADFMQKELLPQVLNFILENLPRLDQALKNEVLPGLDLSARQFVEQRNEICGKLASFKRVFPSNSGTNAITDRTDKIRNALMNGLTALIEHYDNEFEEQNSTLSDAVERLTASAKAWVNAQYDPRNARQVEEAKNRIRSKMSAIPHAIDEIHAIRIHISEVYSELETIHNDLIVDMQQSVATVLHECFPRLMSTGEGLGRFTELAAQSGDCQEIIDAVRDLMSLEIPFYNTIYPDMRREVFDSVSALEGNFRAQPDCPAEKQAMIVLGELQNIGINWIWKTENLLHSQCKITKIISAALERFQDRMIRNNQTHREMVGFVEHFWSEIQNEGSAYQEDIRAKLEKF